MENNNHLQGEINGFWGDIKATEEQLSCERQNYARRLKNGLGEDIINYLDTDGQYSLDVHFTQRA